LGVSGTIYNNHTLETFKALGLDTQRVKKLASKLHVQSVNYAAKLVHTRSAFSSTIINYQLSSGDDFKPATLLILIGIFFFLWWRSVYPIPKWLLSLIDVGSGFYCLQGFFSFRTTSSGQFFLFSFAVARHAYQYDTMYK
jgi:hypothetical protein